MANDKAFKVKNGILAQRYLQSAGTETAGSEGYNLAGASYDNKSYSVGPTNSTNGIAFKSDGTKLYTTDYVTGGNIKQYSLSTAWDISTASYDSVSLDVSSQETGPSDLVFKSDGTVMYFVGYNSDTIFQYTLSTAWDLSTASYASKSFSVNTQESTPLGFAFNLSGTKLFVVGQLNQAVFQYTLSTAWDISTASYDSVSFSASSQDIYLSGIQFNSDGTEMFLHGDQNETIFKYTLGTAYDVSTASYSNVSFSIAPQASPNTRGLEFGNSGNKMYVVETGGRNIYQYSIASLTQTLDLSTGTYFSFIPSGATTVSFSNPPASGLATGFTVEINGDGSVITWPSSVKWHEATTPTATATKELYTFITTDGGTTYIGKKAAGELA